MGCLFSKQRTSQTQKDEKELNQQRSTNKNLNFDTIQTIQQQDFQKNQNTDPVQISQHRQQDQLNIDHNNAIGTIETHNDDYEKYPFVNNNLRVSKADDNKSPSKFQQSNYQQANSIQSKSSQKNSLINLPFSSETDNNKKEQNDLQKISSNSISKQINQQESKQLSLQIQINSRHKEKDDIDQFNRYQKDELKYSQKSNDQENQDNFNNINNFGVNKETLNSKSNSIYNQQVYPNQLNGEQFSLNKSQSNQESIKSKSLMETLEDKNPNIQNNPISLKNSLKQQEQQNQREGLNMMVNPEDLLVDNIQSFQNNLVTNDQLMQLHDLLNQQIGLELKKKNQITEETQEDQFNQSNLHPSNNLNNIDFPDNRLGNDEQNDLQIRESLKEGQNDNNNIEVNSILFNKKKSLQNGEKQNEEMNIISLQDKKILQDENINDSKSNHNKSNISEKLIQIIDNERQSLNKSKFHPSNNQDIHDQSNYSQDINNMIEVKSEFIISEDVIDKNDNKEVNTSQQNKNVLLPEKEKQEDQINDIISNKNELSQIIDDGIMKISINDSLKQINTSTYSKKNKFNDNQSEEVQSEIISSNLMKREKTTDINQNKNNEIDNISIISKKSLQQDQSDKNNLDQSINSIINQSIDKKNNDEIRSRLVSQVSIKENEKSLIDIKQQDQEESDIQFIDEEFPPKTESICIDSVAYIQQCIKDGKTQYPFKRFSEVITDAPINLFANDTTSIYDVKQGALGDCYFIVCMIVLAQYPDKIKSIFKNKIYNKNGKYVLNLIKNGIPTQVVVDDYVPCYPDSRGFAFAQSPNNTAIWPSLLEKALAKMHKQYLLIEGSNSEGPSTSSVFMHLIGCPSEYHFIEKGKQSSFKDIEAAWDKIYNSHIKGYLQTTGVSNSSFIGEKALDNGLVANHAYSILEVRKIEDLKLIKLKNPWAKTEWKLDWSDESSKWTEYLKNEVNLEVKDDGIFWMSFQDFYTNFSHVSVALFNPSYQYSYLEIKNEKQFGLYQYNLTLSNEENDIEGCLILNQVSERFLTVQNGFNFKSSSISFLVFQMNEDQTKPSSLLANICQNSEMIYSEIKFEKGREYSIFIIADFLTSQCRDIVLSFYCNRKVNLSLENLKKSCDYQILCDYLDQIPLSEYKPFFQDKGDYYEYQKVFGSLIPYIIRNESKNQSIQMEIQFTNENISLVEDTLKFNNNSFYQETEKNKYKLLIPSRQNFKLIFKQKSFNCLTAQIGYRTEGIQLKSEVFPSDAEIEELISKEKKESLINEKVEGEIYEQSITNDIGIIAKYTNTTKNKKFIKRIQFNTKNLQFLNSSDYQQDENRFHTFIVPPQTSILLKFKTYVIGQQRTFNQTYNPYKLENI